jgi:hypothetical protein
MNFQHCGNLKSYKILCISFLLHPIWGFVENHKNWHHRSFSLLLKKLASKSKWTREGWENQWSSVTKHSIGTKHGTDFDKIELTTNIYSYSNQGRQWNKIWTPKRKCNRENKLTYGRLLASYNSEVLPSTYFRLLTSERPPISLCFMIHNFRLLYRLTLKIATVMFTKTWGTIKGMIWHRPED